MYKNLNIASLGVAARQSEVIELALTHSFRGLDVDIADLQKRGLDQAKRFLGSANLNLSFDVSIMLAGDDASFMSQLAQLEGTAHFAAQLGAKMGMMHIQPASEELPFHANFELHRRRLPMVANLLARHKIQLAVGLLAAEAHRTGKYYQFIYQVDQALMLLQTTNCDNITLLLDTWNWTVGGGSLVQLKNLKGLPIGVVRLADVPSNYDPATIKDEERLVPEENCQIDFASILQHLVEVNFTGPITIYPHPSQFNSIRRDGIVQRVSAAYEEKLKAAGIETTGKLSPAAAQG